MNVIARIRSALKWIGRIIALLAAIFFGVWWTSFSFFGNVTTITVTFSTYALFLLVVLTCLVLAWRKGAIGGVILILLSISLGLMTYQISYSFYFWLLLGLPFLVAGVLLFITSQMFILRIKERK